MNSVESELDGEMLWYSRTVLSNSITAVSINKVATAPLAMVFNNIKMTKEMLLTELKLLCVVNVLI